MTEAEVPAGTYTLSETGPAGYTAGDWSCVLGESPPVTGDTLVLGNGDVATCTINNDDQPATITLFKTVTNNNGGTASPTAWSLRGDGPTVFDGATGSVAVTNRTVNAGSYALSEGDGPTGYAAGPWNCVGGGTFSGNVIALANGDNVVCGLNNDDLPATITLVKTVVNDNGGTAEAEDWTLSATGPETISGATGTTAVTEAVVSVGPYTLSETGPAGYTASDWVCTVLEGESTVAPVGGGRGRRPRRRRGRDVHDHQRRRPGHVGSPEGERSAGRSSREAGRHDHLHRHRHEHRRRAGEHPDRHR